MAYTACDEYIPVPVSYTHLAQGQRDSDDLLFHLTSSLSDLFCRLDISPAKRLFLPSKTIIAYRAEVVT